MDREVNRGFLTVTTCPGPGRGSILPPGPTILGRALDVDVVLADSSVSRRHAELVAGDAAVVIRDLGSSSGTFVDGDRLTGTTELSNGDELRVGSVVLRFAAEMLLGGDSPAFAKTETEEIAAQLPDVRIVVLEGQQHVAIDLAPERFVDAVLSFVRATCPSYRPGTQEATQ